MMDGIAEELAIHHGKAGAADGTLKSKNRKRRAFCDVYEFSKATGTEVKQITSYIIETQ
jgi:hypothetical protein